jgi:hypothetical protein
MRSNLLKSAASVLAMLAIVAFAAGTALAEWKMSIQTDGTFGNYTEDHDLDAPGTAGDDSSGDKAQLGAGSYEGNLNFSASSGPVAWKLRLRTRDDVTANSGTGTNNRRTIATHRSELDYKITDQVELQFHSSSFGGPSMAVGDVSGVIGRFAFGDATAYLGMEDKTFLFLNFNAGPAVVGFGLGDECVTNAGCGMYIDAGGTDHTADKNQGTMIVHANGTAGAIKWGLQYVMDSGVYGAKKPGPPVSDDDKDVSSTGIEIGVKWSGPATVGFTYTTIEVGVEKDPLFTQSVDVTENRMKIGVIVAGLAFAYTTVSQELKFTGGKDTTDTTNIDASYAIEVAPGVVIGPELRIENKEVKEDAGAGAVTKTTTDKQLVGIAYSANF